MIQIDMPMPEKCEDCIFCDDNCSCVASEYDGFGINVGCAYRTGRRDIRCPLKEQEAVEPKWTSVKERYPEEEGSYLVSADHGNYHPWIAEMRIFKGIKGFCNGATMPCVGAWMPLPEPYKEGR